MFTYIGKIGMVLLDRYGYWGIAAVSLLLPIYQPVGPDLFILGKSGSGREVYVAALFATMGTCAGAALAYALGRYLGLAALRRVFRVQEKYIAKGEHLFARYGVWGVALAALSPIPLRETGWLAGIFGMRFGRYVTALLVGLIPRFFGVAYLGGRFGSLIWERLH